MNFCKNVILCGALAFFMVNTCGRKLDAQACFEINTAKSKVSLAPSGMRNLPDDGDTLKLACTSKIADFKVQIDFRANVESYFEDSTQFIGTLAYKGLIIILQYNKATNEFSLPVNQEDLGAGNYFFTITATTCTPNGQPCDNCLFTQDFEVVYVGDSSFQIFIETNPNPPVLTCFPGSAVVLKGTEIPNNNFKAQWYKLFNNQFVKISGATENIYNALQAGSYKYTLSGPAGCAWEEDVMVLPPEYPEVTMQPDTQTLSSCTQKITGLSVKNDGGNGNLEYFWTALNGGIIKSGDTTQTPLVSAPGGYRIAVTRKDNGCTTDAAMTMLLGNLPSVQVQITRDPLKTQLDCNVKKITLLAEATLSMGTSGFTYVWPQGAGQTIVADKPGNYAVTATAASNGCQGTALVEITQNVSPPGLDILSTRDTVCAGESLILTAVPQEPVAFSWPDHSISNSYSATPGTDGPNTYVVTVTSAGNGCSNTALKTIYRVPMPEISCTVTEVVVESGNQASLDCSVTNGEMFWVATSVNVRDIPPLGNGPVQNQVFVLSNTQAPGIVEYFFYGKNAGCISEKSEVLASVTPKSEDGIYIPELITPNGDGQNDTWGIVLPDAFNDPERYSLQLFNRYGALVFEGSLAVPFNANRYPDGTYYYVLTKPDGGLIRGAVTILRRQ